jgi:hypothetical protein
LCDITQELTDQLGQIERGGFSMTAEQARLFCRRSPTSHVAGARPARDLILVSTFYWDQNDQARSFGIRFIAV